MIVSILNQKGGVGKTTTALNLGVALAQAGQRVLLIDLDPQGTLLFYAENGDGQNSQVTEGNATDGIYQGMQILEGKRSNLERLLGRTAFDIALLDCPPTLSEATAAALKKADLAIAPTPPRVLDLAGLAQLRESVAEVRGRGNPGLRLRILLTMRDARITLQQDYEMKLRSAFPQETFHTTIPRAAVFEKAADAHQPILTFAPRSPAATAYRALAQEVMQLG